MPCRDYSEADERALQHNEELNRNERLYGVKDTNLNIATRVACELAQGFVTQSPLVKKWVAEHKRQDDQRHHDEQRSLRRAVENCYADLLNAEQRHKDASAALLNHINQHGKKKEK